MIPKNRLNRVYLKTVIGIVFFTLGYSSYGFSKDGPSILDRCNKAVSDLKGQVRVDQLGTILSEAERNEIYLKNSNQMAQYLKCLLYYDENTGDTAANFETLKDYLEGRSDTLNNSRFNLNNKKSEQSIKSNHKEGAPIETPRTLFESALISNVLTIADRKEIIRILKSLKGTGLDEN